MKFRKVMPVLFLTVLLITVLCVPALAVTEGEVASQVAAAGKEAVTGNVLIWFLCAVAFLKVSQKIDSFMATLGVNVGRTGGSMLAEAMIAMRSVTMVIGGGHGAGRAGSTSGGAAGKSGGSGMAGFFKGGLVGMAGRHVTNSAVKTATTQTSAVHTAQNQVSQAASFSAAQTASSVHSSSDVHLGGSAVHTESAVPNNTPPQEGVIVTGAVSQAAAIESTPFTNPVPSGTPPQEGTILTGGEPTPSIPQADSTPQSADTPSVSVPPDMTPPQEGVIITGGDTSIHAPQQKDVFPSAPSGPSYQGTADAAGGGHAQTERVSQSVHTSASSEKVQTSRFHTSGAARPTLGGMVFSRSLAASGSFANEVIGTVARGEVAGSITGDMAAQSLSSYMGQAAPGIGSGASPSYSEVEIGRGRITGVETAAGASEGQAFAMYHVEQFTAPSGEYSKVVSADGTQWYKQYAQDAVERKPCMAPDDTVAYHERIIKKLPDPPKRRDRM